MTSEKIFSIAKAQGYFRTSLRFRDRGDRTRCHQLMNMGLLILNSRRAADASVYYLTDRGRATKSLAQLQKSKGAAVPLPDKEMV